MNARGRVLGARGGLLEIAIPGARVGGAVRVETAAGTANGTIRSVDACGALVSLHGSLDGIATGTLAYAPPAAQRLPLGTAALGRAFDANANALDDAGPVRGVPTIVQLRAPAPSERSPVRVPLWTGVRVLDALLTFGRGARIGIFGAPGTGKSTLLESIVQGCGVDAVVIGLVGERGREAERWIHSIDERTSIVVATSDRCAGERVQAAHVAATQAVTLRKRGLHVLWVLDSLARVAAALRELGVAAGESTGRGGYPPSVFSEMSRLVEVAGAGRNGGSITLVASVLDDGDDRDPVSDAARSLLDGHVALSSRVAAGGRFPAIDVLASASRTMDAVVVERHRSAARTLRGAIALLERTDDARSLGILPADPYALSIVSHEASIEAFVRQGEEAEVPAQTLAALAKLADTVGEPHGH
jgi:ATP synthase in type III secretion protein N